ncbi:MAG: glycerol kinase GlpK [Actinomycetes bacterium]
MSVLAVDAGTTGVTALIVSGQAQILARGYCEFAQHFPSEGWVEHEPEQIWAATLAAVDLALAALGDHADRPTAVGITNQRETIVLWDRLTLAAPRRAIVWQDRRTAGICDQLRGDGHEPRVSALTGLRLDPYFSATKLTWIALNEPDIWAGVIEGTTAIGTIDSYLIARMTSGTVHITDASNASRTLLFDIHTVSWSQELCDLFRVPMAALPRVVSSYGVVATTSPDLFAGLELPIAGIAGDQQAALFGQACFAPGSSKCTYGTGSFVLVNTGSEPAQSSAGLLTTVAWQHPDGSVDYALEGAIFVTGAAVQWLRDGLGIISSAGETDSLARSVPDSGGVVFVPALTGLGAPDWDPHARGAIFGLSRGTTRAHIVRATLEAIAYEVADVVALMAREGGITLPVLAVDGGAAANDFLCQAQADVLQVPVLRASVLETTGLGAAFLAGLATGVWPSFAAISELVAQGAHFEPGGRDDSGYRRWRTAVERSKGWANL